ncbi:MAG TPA: 16S rRNA (cytidine(1402)-2'-O)-methyltransferase [Chitinophagales bacterium]|nr:16S rRNA (cytidine(1402)-2'-O)-methyltransferase [Chitinophagales bacterium]HMZ32843.1 16S rRNA (cytidine(1402)-2'-O)-methyltransferase [Chitinophagales bacterium]HNA38243.1 16S rRNA (cytidine(1402)-2'-O)-methyltransferase [Chitinophagales bacterium]HNB48313.1 16S rRNA (cytidine(1402)-2'-O)-methyltransferase [Chitinophagales bacterium]HND84060.1 16S rRNA (cytidine(1402)-2'-O)-methyltransferase [Chitinophagales bacterium]
MSKLYIVPTPIGNLQDITLRAIDTLKSVQLILAEDTRTSKFLCQHFLIDTPLQAYHKDNEHKAVDAIVQKIKSGVEMALVSDAGTPAISDPGFLLVRACLQNDIAVECLPGATAFVPALVNAGFPTDRFVFEGFLPHQKGRQKRLQALQEETRTIVFYESPYRIVKLLEELNAYFGGNRRIAISRELTKKFEENFRGSIAEAIIHFTQKEPKGEFVVVLEGKTKEEHIAISNKEKYGK